MKLTGERSRGLHPGPVVHTGSFGEDRLFESGSIPLSRPRVVIQVHPVHPLDRGLRKLAQIGFVCRDIEATAQRWADLLGVPKPEIQLTAPGSTCGMHVHGQPSNAQAKLAFFDLGGVQLELIQPLGGASSWQETLDRRGEGFHHLGFWVDDASRASALLEEAGCPEVHRGTFPGGGYAYHDATATLATTLEILHRSAGQHEAFR